MKTKNNDIDGVERFNRVSPAVNIIILIFFLILAFICVIPVVFVIMISISSEASITAHGYQFWPSEFSLEAYKYLWDSRKLILNALVISIVVTVAGTIVGIFLNATMGYVLSRRNFKFRKFFTYIVFIPMIFNGGLISTYFTVSSFLGLKDSILALILPLAVSSFYIVIMRTFFTTTIPEEIIESAKIDGAAQFRIFFTIVLPISLPVLATIGIFLAFAYWNDWFQSLLYINNPSLFSLQALLSKIDSNIEYMAKNAFSMGISQAELASRMPKEAMRMAIVVVIVVPIACVYPFFQKYFISGLTVGAVKG